MMSFQIWLIVKDSVMVIDHVIYCRSWPPQGQLPECFNTDMPSSKVFSTSSILYTLTHFSCIIQVNALLEVLRDVLANNECDRSPKW